MFDMWHWLWLNVGQKNHTICDCYILFERTGPFWASLFSSPRAAFSSNSCCMALTCCMHNFVIFLCLCFPLFSICRSPEAHEDIIKGKAITALFFSHCICICFATCTPSCIQWAVLIASKPDQNTCQQGVLFILWLSSVRFCNMGRCGRCGPE